MWKNSATSRNTISQPGNLLISALVNSRGIVPKLMEKKPVAYQPNDICCPKIRLEGITNVALQSIFEKLSVPTQYAGELQ